jgi:putative endonuclease
MTSEMYNYYMAKTYYVYILTNKNNQVLYTGVTNHLLRRVQEHRDKLVPGFTQKYNVTKLVYYETFDDPRSAITREKQIKAGSRQKKITLIESINPEWMDIFDQIIV